MSSKRLLPEPPRLATKRNPKKALETMLETDVRSLKECRALGIPARYASAYADAFFQAYPYGPNGGEWHSFDTSQMSSLTGQCPASLASA